MIINPCVGILLIFRPEARVVQRGWDLGCGSILDLKFGL